MDRRGKLIRNEIPELLRGRVGEYGFSVNGRDAMGRPSRIPWVRVFDRELSPNASEGTYAVFLFAADGSAVFLSLNQGTMKRVGKTGRYASISADRVLAIRDDARLRLQQQHCDLENLVKDISLQDPATGAKYEVGNIYSLRYDVNSVPPDATIYADVSRILSFWNVLCPDANSGPDPGGMSAMAPTSLAPSAETFLFSPNPPSALTQSALAELAATQRTMVLKHNSMQRALYERLERIFGENQVGCENFTCLKTRIDLVVKYDGKHRFYEIKTDPSPRVCLRQAIGQLLEYAFFGPGRPEEVELVVVGKTRIDKEGEDYLQLLNKRFDLSIEYETVEK